MVETVDNGRDGKRRLTMVGEVRSSRRRKYNQKVRSKMGTECCPDFTRIQNIVLKIGTFLKKWKTKYSRNSCVTVKE